MVITEVVKVLVELGMKGVKVEVVVEELGKVMEFWRQWRQWRWWPEGEGNGRGRGGGSRE